MPPACVAYYLETNAAQAGGITLRFTNPVEDILFIQSEKENAPFILTDAKGASVMQGQIISFQQNINIRHLPSGTYFLAVNDEIIKLIKQ